jgi:cell division protein FtsX
MTTVFFRFQEHASEENQDQAQNEILKLPGVRTVARVSPDAKMDSLRRLWFADVADEGTATDVATRLRQRDDIHSADLPPKRGLI